MSEMPAGLMGFDSCVAAGPLDCASADGSRLAGGAGGTSLRWRAAPVRAAAGAPSAAAEGPRGGAGGRVRSRQVEAAADMGVCGGVGVPCTYASCEPRAGCEARGRQGFSFCVHAHTPSSYLPSRPAPGEVPAAALPQRQRG